MRSVQTIDPFSPAFCNRGSGCKADPADNFCSGCGADIAGYLDAMTASHAAAPTAASEELNVSAQEPTLPMTRVSVFAGPPIGTAAPADEGRGGWGTVLRDRVILAVFAGSALLGAGGALLADLA